MKQWQKFFVGVLAMLFGFHFFATVLYLLPEHPLRRPLAGLTTHVVRFFPQNWNFFAPTPLRTNNSVLVQCLNTKSEKPLPTAWVDISKPLWEAHQNARISAYDRLSRTISDPVRNYISQPKSLINIHKRCLAKEKSACETHERIMTRVRKAALEQLDRPVSGYCADLARQQARQPYAFAAVRLRITEPPDWQHRRELRKESDVEIGTRPTVRVVAPNIYRP
jgi:hypothetical protein